MPVSSTADRLLNQQAPRQTAVTGVVRGVDPATERVSVDRAAEAVNLRHAFVSDASWIRSVPNAGTRVSVAINPETNRYEIQEYRANDPKDALEQYAQKKSLYRPLKGGEHEVVSSGGAVSFWGSLPFQEHRAGSIRTTLDGTKMEMEHKAPTHVQRLHKNRSDVIGDEIRVGLVKRPLSADRSIYALLPPASNPLIGSFQFAKEYLVNLKDDVFSTDLIDIRSGHVYDDVLAPGVPFAMPRMGDNGLPLRHHAKYFVTIEPGGIPAPMQFTEMQVDSLGNVAVNLSKLSVMGFAMSVPLGKIAVNCGLDFSLDAKTGITITTLGNAVIKGTAGVKVESAASVIVEGTASVDVRSTGPVSVKSDSTVEVSGMLGVNIKGAAQGLTSVGPYGVVATAKTCFVTGVPLSADPTITA